MNLYGPKQLIDSMRTVRKNTILIAEDIPEKDYGYRPAPKSRSVAETLVHIASLSRIDRVIHEEQIIDLLRAEGERWSQWVGSLPEALLAEQVRMPGGASKSRFEMLLGTKEHEMHHRAQLTVMERLLGIVPHLTRNRQPRRAVTAEAATQQAP